MTAQNPLVHSRTRIRQRFALFPLDGYPPSKLPTWHDCQVRILTAPAMGANFAAYLFDLPANYTHTETPAATQVFGFLLSGAAQLQILGNDQELLAGGFFYVPQTRPFRLHTNKPSRLLLLRKRYEPCTTVDVSMPEPIVGDSASVPGTPFLGDEHARLQELLPDTFAYDLAMNIFTFDPDHGLPFVETHVMEHGLLMLQGKGMYYLDGEWMEVQKDDFIWMGPYCPQWFRDCGPEPTRYIYYKNVNREIAL